jgi:glycosyltransferase involved in cell wall biosynthesis
MQNEANGHQRIIFHGRRTPDEVMAMMCSSGILLHPSAVEMIPNVIKEAMMCGAIVIASRTDGIEEIIDNNINGFIVDSQELNTFVQAIEKVLFMQEDRAYEIRRSGMRKVLAQFDVEKNMETYNQFWQIHQDRHC